MNYPTNSANQFLFSDMFYPKQISHLSPTATAMAITRFKAEMNPFVPSINRKYVFRYSDGFRKLVQYLRNGKGQLPWIYGPQGCGKTSGVSQLAAWFRAELRQVYVSDTTETQDLLCGYIPSEEGGAKLKYYALAKAMDEGHWLLINEFDQLPPSQQKELNQIIEERVAELPNGIRIKAHPNFRLIVSANTNGTGDATGNFGNTEASDVSVPDRFFFVPTDYLEEEEETKLLRDTGVQKLSEIVDTSAISKQAWNSLNQSVNAMVSAIVSYANVIRKSYKAALAGNDGVSYTCSQRVTIEWIEQAVEDMFWEKDPKLGISNAMKKAFQHAFLYGLNPENQILASDTYDEKIGDSLSVLA
ncbi:AAA family ATPase [Vibrio sp. Y2-5]|uniref:AAA family ATPase n=1 Tax=Vibrio sp. Y2-5 TaxID=2743977 RepID=UPI001660793F|nr:AAA family ATPase [Vibrio sp. Y2-5]MBD0788047.1 AAA family ATPase [Vibrio sp. Y2-5]